ncbi:MAG: nucleotidyltransferase domain-containing protein [Candidatus Lokiarchaeota archaeon]|nr:nucleotidyltransferase domain-containing protein [Candidatus Harpocratesius repetitus]
MKSEIISQIRNDLKDLSNFDMVLFGSQVEGGNRPNSDYDIAILIYSENEQETSPIFQKFLPYNFKPYEIHIFETLPIQIQISVIKNYKVVFGDPLEISEYFYGFRKRWDDCKHRIFENMFQSSKEREILRRRSKPILEKIKK